MSHHLVRWAGFAGSVLLAVSAYLGGALPSSPLRSSPVAIWQSRHGPVVLAAWLVGTGLMAWAWWALRNRDLHPRRVLVTAGLWLLPMLVAPPFGSRDVYAYACQGASFAGGISPYEQGVSTLPCPWLETVSPIWRDTPAPYGPLFVLMAGAVVGITDSLTASIVAFRVICLLGVVATAYAVPPLARRCGVPVGRALWLALACPLVAVHLVGGPHNDSLMIAPLVGGLAVVASRPGRRWPLLGGGALLGVAVAVKVTAVVVVPFAVLAAVVGPATLRSVIRDGGWVLVGAVATMVGITFGGGLDFGWIGGLTTGGAAVAWTSPPTAVGQTINSVAQLFGSGIDAIPAARAAGVVVLAGTLVWMWFRAWHQDPLRYAGLALAVTVALASVVHPWYWTWPLAVIAATTVRSTWAALVALVSLFLILPDGVGLARYTKIPGAPLMTLLLILGAVALVRSFRAEDRLRAAERAGRTG
ncbi:polyprenol phosphomannose-dependent alpha 1,6 mannosyltransferase MptB [Micromonospora fluostatini]|uniref:polyprenol phosphomannose-dependent alpha 1,6 mannosyltransferase MptB n=1 Tax=Micromonospora sp. JCM 30529 TaxID=3421643 RepID=UPI003D1815F6